MDDERDGMDSIDRIKSVDENQILFPVSIELFFFLKSVTPLSYVKIAIYMPRATHPMYNGFFMIEQHIM